MPLLLMHHLADHLSVLLDYDFLGNTVREIFTVLVGILIGVAALRLFQIFIVRRLRKIFAATATTWDDLLVDELERDIIPSLYVLIVWLGLRDLHLKESMRDGLRTLAVIAITFLGVRVALAFVSHSIQSYWQKHASDRTAAREKNLHGIITMAKMVVWALGFILLLDNLGIKVSAFVAGLGITGIAVALAAQTILGDLFSYFVIFFDQPFEVGHSIKVEQYQGEVEHIGLKTTRLRSPDGEQIVISNKFLTDSRVQNFKRMHRRRATFNLDLEHGTAPALLRGVPDLIKAQFARFSDVTFERCHLRGMQEYGLRFETAYVIETPDFRRYLDIQHEVNLGLQEEFAKAGIRFAFPNRVVQLRSAPPIATIFPSGAAREES